MSKCLKQHFYMQVGKWLFISLAMSSFLVFCSKTAESCSMGALFLGTGAIGPCPTTPLSNTNRAISAIENTMTAISSAQQDLMIAEEFYQYMKSFAYMKASPGLFGAVTYIGNAVSGASNMAQQGVTAYQNTATSFGASSYAMSPAEYTNMSGTLGLVASTSGSLSSMGSTLSMLNNENGGAGGLALINGASLATQAALTGAEGTLNILNYYNNKDIQQGLQQNMAATYEKQKATAMRPAHIPIPCRNIPAYLPLSGPLGTVGGKGGTAAINTPGSACNTVGVGSPVDFSNSAGMGANQAMQQYNQQQVNQAISQGAPVTLPPVPPANIPEVPGGGRVPPQVGVQP